MVQETSLTEFRRDPDRVSRVSDNIDTILP